MMKKGYEVDVSTTEDGWKDVILPTGALKSGKLNGLIGFQEYIPTVSKPTKSSKVSKKSKSNRKRKNAEILFEEKSVEKPTVEKKPKKQPKKQKKSKGENFALTDEEKAISNDEYKFVNNLHEWKRFNLDTGLLRAIDTLGLLSPTEIQRKTIPLGLNSKNTVMAAAETGSGKTFAYALPILNKIIGFIAKYGKSEAKKSEIKISVDLENREEFVEANDESSDGPQCLILCPTRELAYQVHNAIRRVSKFTSVSTTVVVGGISQEKQERVLSSNRPEIVVATPGRLWELQSQGQEYLQNLHTVKYLVIDEADRMAQKGHFAELENIVQSVGTCQKFIFSATLTLTHKGSTRLKNAAPETSEEKLKKLMKTIGVKKEEASVVDLSNSTLVASTLEEYRVSINSDKEKDTWLYWLLLRRTGRAIVFTNSITGAHRLRGLLSTLKLPIHALHAQLKQRQRLAHLDRFRKSDDAILIATDVAARGLDIPGVELIIHFQFPNTAESYVHRSGRAGRAGKAGIAVALIKDSDHHNYKKVMNTLKKGMLNHYDGQGPSKEISERIDLAVKVDVYSHRKRKTNSDKNWLKKHAELCDIELSEEDDEEESENTREENEYLAQKARLNELLKNTVQ